MPPRENRNPACPQAPWTEAKSWHQPDSRRLSASTGLLPCSVRPNRMLNNFLLNVPNSKRSQAIPAASFWDLPLCSFFTILLGIPPPLRTPHLDGCGPAPQGPEMKPELSPPMQPTQRLWLFSTCWYAKVHPHTEDPLTDKWPSCTASQFIFQRNTFRDWAFPSSQLHFGSSHKMSHL